jgi:hypothetical protein
MTLGSRALTWPAGQSSIRMSNSILLSMLLLTGATVATAADDPCTGGKWDITQEHALFSKAPEAISAGKDLTSAPVMTAQKMYELALSPQTGVTFILPPAKKMLADGAFAGLVHMQVPAAGAYRVSLDQGFWIDVVGNQKFIESTDFGGVPGCTAPRKVVIFNLPAGDLVLQISGAMKDHVRVTLTPAPAAAH